MTNHRWNPLTLRCDCGTPIATQADHDRHTRHPHPHPTPGDTMNTEAIGIETYPVGLLADIKRKRVRYGLSYLQGQLKRRNWRAVRSYFNGYLAEWHFRPDGVRLARCGSGWTRRAALRSLGKHIVASNLIDHRPEGA